MYILNVFWPMLNDVTWRNASVRQIYGIRTWEDYVRRAVLSAPDGAAPQGSMDVAFNGSATHRTWQITCWGILSALASQASEAQASKALADDEAASRDRAADQCLTDEAAARRQAAAARDTASAARERAARERAAAGTCADHALAAAHLAAAAQADADATAAEAHAAAAEAAAAEHAAAGVRHREEAGKARELSRRFLEWDITASDAHTFGERVLRNEQPIAVRVGEGIAAAGGLREVPASKRYAAAS